ncbi:MAG: tRNA lysidine(34) synthetase TilS [Acidimicrobiia bacterium]|nr:tRNA lysidine(34) synthetase TilS [Acidimicrobiia bacterium]
MAVPSGLSPAATAACEAVADIAPGPLVIALSGGADSAVVAWASVTVRPAGTVRAVHVNHGWDASPGLQVAAAAVADHLHIPFRSVYVVPETGPSPEGAAREARLAALLDAAAGETIVMGHHADDAAETVVANLLRGAGATGLSGITPERGPFVRPLLQMRRAELRAVADELALPYVDDPSNDDQTHRRNYIRHEIIPELDRHFDGDLVDVVVRSAQHLAAEDAYLDDVAADGVAAADGDATLLAIAPLITMPAVLAKRAVRKALRAVHPPYPGSSREVDAVLAVTMGRAPRRDLSEGFVAEREGPYVSIYRPARPQVGDPVELEVPGRVQFGEHLIRATPATSGEQARMSSDWCRLALPRGGLVVRAAAPGDRVDIGTGSKKVADALNEAAVPVRKRPAWPVVESRGRIAWVAGVRVASWARVETSLSTWVELERQAS